MVENSAPDPWLQEVYDKECPTCSAPPGVPCYTASGKQATTLHTRRHWAAYGHPQGKGKRPGPGPR